MADAPIPLRPSESQTYVVHLIESFKIRAATEDNAVWQAESGLFDPDTIDVQVEVLKED